MRQVMSFEREADLLRRWQSLVLETDPDVIIGYNITNFDMPYLFERAQALRIDSEAHQWGRIRHRWVNNYWGCCVSAAIMKFVND